MHKFTKRTPRLLSLIAASTLALTGSVVSLTPHAAAAATPAAPTAATDALVKNAVHNSLLNPLRTTAAPKVEASKSGRFIVVMTGKPTVAYDGTVAGLEATKPKPGLKLDPTQASVQKYETHLKAAQSEVAATKGVKVKKNFTTALNGFVAQLDTVQAKDLAKDPRVLMVVPDKQFAPTGNSGDFVGLTGTNGVWQKQFGATADAGAGTVIGIIDTGYTPTSAYFRGSEVKPLARGVAPVVGVPYLKAPGVIAMLKKDGNTFEGLCQAGEKFAATTCNSKVISARYFADAFLDDTYDFERSPLEVISPIDSVGHGTHTASTAGGYRLGKTMIGGYDVGQSTGMAPGAKLAIYKTCWEDRVVATGGCYGSSAIEAINQAVNDGVDVINYSISSDPTTTTDPISLAFLSAVGSGVFVAASAGNSGSTESTVVHGAPWLTSVAASTWTNRFDATLVLSDGTKLRGTSSNRTPLAATSIILAKDAAVADAKSPELCATGTLDPAKAKGKIVVCDRGVVDRTQKSDDVKRAGGVGMILANTIDSSLDADQHAVPTIHIQANYGNGLKKLLVAKPETKASFEITDTTGKPKDPLPQVAAFSSRGPLIATGGDLLKPDITAPGVNVLAGISPIASKGEMYGFMSGTSMASPHIAGLAALVLSKNPLWSPAQVKSAMMTTAKPTLTDEGKPNKDLFAMGAGQVQPTSMFNPGLTLDATEDDYFSFIAGQGMDLGIAGSAPIKGYDINVPSIAIGRLTGTVTVKRTFTAMEAGTFKITATVPGIDVQLGQSNISFSAAGEKRTVLFKFTRIPGLLNLNRYMMGNIVLNGNNKTVTMPVAVRPVAADAPASMNFKSVDGKGSGIIPVTSGTDAYTYKTYGLVKADETKGSAVPGDISAETNAHNIVKNVKIPAGMDVTRFAIDSDKATSNWDIFVIKEDGSFLRSMTPNASEAVIAENLPAGDYLVIARLAASANNESSNGSLTIGSMMRENLGNVSPEVGMVKTANGVEADIPLSWKDLTPGTWIGVVDIGGAADDVFVTIHDTAGAAPAAVEEPDFTGTDNNEMTPAGPGVITSGAGLQQPLDPEDAEALNKIATAEATNPNTVVSSEAAAPSQTTSVSRSVIFGAPVTQ